MRESGGRFGKMGAVVAELVGMGGRGTSSAPRDRVLLLPSTALSAGREFLKPSLLTSEKAVLFLYGAFIFVNEAQRVSLCSADEQ